MLSKCIVSIFLVLSVVFYNSFNSKTFYFDLVINGHLPYDLNIQEFELLLNESLNNESGSLLNRCSKVLKKINHYESFTLKRKSLRQIDSTLIIKKPIAMIGSFEILFDDATVGRKLTPAINKLPIITSPIELSQIKREKIINLISMMDGIKTIHVDSLMQAHITFNDNSLMRLSNIDYPIDSNENKLS